VILQLTTVLLSAYPDTGHVPVFQRRNHRRGFTRAPLEKSHVDQDSDRSACVPPRDYVVRRRVLRFRLLRQELLQSVRLLQVTPSDRDL
jgi:hypothetical protein